jgi:hypothetical protein
MPILLFPKAYPKQRQDGRGGQAHICAFFLRCGYSKLEIYQCDQRIVSTRVPPVVGVAIEQTRLSVIYLIGLATQMFHLQVRQKC